MTDVELLADAVVKRLKVALAEMLPEVRDPRPLLTVDDVAEQLGVSRRSAQSLIYPLESAVIPSFEVGPHGGGRRVAPADLDAYVAACRNGE